MNRMVSFIIILVCVLLVATAFVWVMAPFLLPMFLAVLLVVMFRPLQAYFLRKCKGHTRLAAGLTTTAIIVIVLAPLLVVLVKAAAEGYVLASTIDQNAIREASATKAGRLFDHLREFGDKYGIKIPDNQELAKNGFEHDRGLAGAGGLADHAVRLGGAGGFGCDDRLAVFLSWPTVRRWFIR